jgi:ElaB/YqjD/DUF883 family membrane-anchored ribosome-binding protein
MNIQQIKARLLEMTGYTDDPEEALAQFENERQALAEIFDVSQRQDELLTSLARRVDELLPALRNRRGVKWETVNEVIDKLNEWREGVVKSHKQVIEAEETVKQLSLFSEAR